MLRVIADCGATKAAWAVESDASGERRICRFTTRGFNAAVENDFRPVLSELQARMENAGMWEECRHDGVQIWFYGAGVTSMETSSTVKDTFIGLFPKACVEVSSDMLGAARAVCGHAPGIVGIIGTGSNSCLYDGEQIALCGLGGGYVLGDEASGAWFGKRLLSDFIRQLLPADLSEALRDEYGLDYKTIVGNVYGGVAPSAYLASFFPFILSHSSHGYVAGLLHEGFGLFFDRVLSRYYVQAGSNDGEKGRNYVKSDCPLHFCGSVAFLCQDVIDECARRRGLSVATFQSSPLEGLVAYHLL